jgi:outer membrane protein OmpA-like peptidoglycan-associated protein
MMYQQSKFFKTTLGFCLISLFTFNVIAQEDEKQKPVNLVPNASFENVVGKLKGLGSIESAEGWMSPTGVRADIFVPSKKLLAINVPENDMGKEEPKDGENYAGVVAFSFGDKSPRSYMMTKLSTPLKKGQKYCVKFYVSLAEGSLYASNQLGIHFSSKPLGTDQKVSIIEKTHVLQAENKIFNAKYNWDEVCAEFIAEGGEKYITIGNFTSNEDTKFEKVKKDKSYTKEYYAMAYYYIDNVSVEMVPVSEICQCQEQKKKAEAYSSLIYQKVVTLKDDMTPKEKIEKQNLYFGAGSANLTIEAKKSLDLIIAMMKANPSMKLEVKGHNDAMESKLALDEEMYRDIANKRIASVVAYLTSNGISESSIIPTLMGSMEENSEIVESDEEELKNAKNRWVSFKVR